MTDIKGQLGAGKVPDAIPIFALPFFATEGGLCSCCYRGCVQRVDSSGARLWSVPLDVPEGQP
jgi:hypothetical protein